MTATATESVTHDIEKLARAARIAARSVARSTGDERRDALMSMADALATARGEIVAANAIDLATAAENGVSGPLLDRLRLDAAGVDQLAAAVREIAEQPDPLGSLEDEEVRPNGLRVARMRIPLGVVAMIYESRPNVTSDAAALCLKAGNAVQLVSTPDRSAIDVLLEQEDSIDLVIPRGGEGLIRAVTRKSRIPVLQHYKGVCHVFVDATAPEGRAREIVLNAKVQRPGVCNALETLLVHADAAPRVLPAVGAALVDAGVELRGCARTREILDGVPVVSATEEDWHAEYLDLILAVRVVDDLEAALEHIATYGSDHTEAIVTDDEASARAFVAAVQSSTVLVNASTRFADGGELGLGAEIGISTSKLHAFGPMGARELTTRKFVVTGEGQVRS
jgi:glutamate-5-semialdehyde dehydrogenase